MGDRSPPPPMRQLHWRSNLRLTGRLMAVGWVVTFGVSFFARELDFRLVGGWPFSFWMGAQGALLIYVLIVAVYARYMAKIDQRCGVAEPEDEAE